MRPSRSIPYLWIEFPICSTCFHDSPVFALAIHRRGISFPFVVSAPPACGSPEVLAFDCMEMLRPVSPIRRQGRRRACAATNDDECLVFLSAKERKKVSMRGVAPTAKRAWDLPSSRRCCPGGKRESLVKMLLEIDAWSLFRRDRMVDVDRGSSPLPLDRVDISGSGKAYG